MVKYVYLESSKVHTLCEQLSWLHVEELQRELLRERAAIEDAIAFRRSENSKR